MKNNFEQIEAGTMDMCTAAHQVHAKNVEQSRALLAACPFEIRQALAPLHEAMLKTSEILITRLEETTKVAIAAGEAVEKLNGSNDRE